jgi:membrane fusion protein (multidrug efflux system)
MKTKITIAIFISLLVVGALAGVKALQIKKMIAGAQAAGTPAETVSSTVVREDKWQSALSAIGSVSAVQGVTVTPEIAGIIREIAFESGALVKQGDLLVRLDTSSEEAQLRAVKAQLDLALLNLERARALRAENTVSQAEVDAAEATVNQLQANADTISTTIEKKTIRAPFTGQLGIRQVNLGQYLDPGKPIVSLQALSPVYVDFSLPQQDLANLKTGMIVRLSTDAYPGRKFEGKLTAINPDLDQSTRSVALQATLENPDQALRPGMFASLEVLLPEQQDVLIIPATAVLSAPFGDSVYVIEPKSPKDDKGGQENGEAGLIVRQQFIRTGRARGDFLSVVSGLKPGERIVSSGVFKLRNGMPVVENNELVPKAAEAPRPADS